jgi:hypothetical protein
MKADAAEVDADQAFCRGQVHKTDRLFRISLLFAPQGISDRILAAHALFSAIEESTSCVSEEDISRRKLAWWYSELLEKEVSESAHPIARLLHTSGARNCIGDSPIGSLLGTALTGLDFSPPPTEAALWDRCRNLFYPRLKMEMAVLEGPSDDAGGHSLELLAIRGGLLQLIRESSRMGPGSYGWLPLNLMARHGLTRTQFCNDPGSGQARQVLGDVFHSFREFMMESGADRDDLPADVLQPHLHLRVHSNMQARQLFNLQNCSPSRYHKELQAMRVGLLWSAWREARRT